MDTRRFDKHETPLSLLGFGCMRLPLTSKITKRIDKKAGFAMVDYALQNGVNYFDTAYMYHGGKSESFVGEALSRYPRESYLLATKMPVWLAKNEDSLEKIFARQLERCQTNYFDYYLVHNLTETWYKRCKNLKVVEFLMQKKKEGKIRHLGFSFHDKPPLLAQIVKDYAWDFAQIQLNYLDWELQDAKTQYEILTKHNIPVIVMEPVRGGALANPTKEAQAVFQAADSSRSPAAWALRYCASLPNVLTVLSGMSNLPQLQENIATLSNFSPLTKEEYGVIAKALAAHKKAQTIPCTACEYCLPCPNGVAIPKVFGTLNTYKTGMPLDLFLADYHLIPSEAQASACTGCGVCEQQCPQHIKIAKEMASIQKTIADFESAKPQ